MQLHKKADPVSGIPIAHTRFKEGDMSTRYVMGAAALLVALTGCQGGPDASVDPADEAAGKADTPLLSEDYHFTCFEKSGITAYPTFSGGGSFKAMVPSDVDGWSSKPPANRNYNRNGKYPFTGGNADFILNYSPISRDDSVSAQISSGSVIWQLAGAPGQLDNSIELSFDDAKAARTQYRVSGLQLTVSGAEGRKDGKLSVTDETGAESSYPADCDFTPELALRPYGAQ
jgi:hypothetical protein